MIDFNAKAREVVENIYIDTESIDAGRGAAVIATALAEAVAAARHQAIEECIWAVEKQHEGYKSLLSYRKLVEALCSLEFNPIPASSIPPRDTK